MTTTAKTCGHTECANLILNVNKVMKTANNNNNNNNNNNILSQNHAVEGRYGTFQLYQ